MYYFFLETVYTDGIAEGFVGFIREIPVCRFLVHHHGFHDKEQIQNLILKVLAIDITHCSTRWG